MCLGYHLLCIRYILKIEFQIRSRSCYYTRQIEFVFIKWWFDGLGDNINTRSFLPGSSRSLWQSQGQGITASSQLSGGHLFALVPLGINPGFSQQYKYWMWQVWKPKERFLTDYRKWVWCLCVDICIIKSPSTTKNSCSFTPAPSNMPMIRWELRTRSPSKLLCTILGTVKKAEEHCVTATGMLYFCSWGCPPSTTNWRISVPALPSQVGWRSSRWMGFPRSRCAVRTHTGYVTGHLWHLNHLYSNQKKSEFTLNCPHLPTGAQHTLSETNTWL